MLVKPKCIIHYPVSFEHNKVLLKGFICFTVYGRYFLRKECQNAIVSLRNLTATAKDMLAEKIRCVCVCEKQMPFKQLIKNN